MTLARLLGAVIGGILVLAAVGLAVVWNTFRAYAPPDKCLVLIRKTGAPQPPGQKIAEEGQKGIQRRALGPGRYFYNPWAWDWELHDLLEIPAGDPKTWDFVYQAGDPDYQVPKIEGQWPKVGIVTSLAGKPWDKESEVVDEGYQGIQRRVLTPGTYRLNPRAYKTELADAVVVPLGCCGVVTSQLGEMPGVEIVTEKIIGPDGETIEGERKQVQKLAEEAGTIPHCSDMPMQPCVETEAAPGGMEGDEGASRLQDRSDSRLTDLEDKMERAMKELEDNLNARLQRALDNPLAN